MNWPLFVILVCWVLVVFSGVRYVCVRWGHQRWSDWP
jgi:hypothetical protein